MMLQKLKEQDHQAAKIQVELTKEVVLKDLVEAVVLVLLELIGQVVMEELEELEFLLQ